MVDSILNASQDSYAKLADLNSSFQQNTLNSPTEAEATKSSKILIKKMPRKPKAQRSLKNSVGSANSNLQRLTANNVLIDASNEPNNLPIELDVNDSCCDSETTSGRFTATNNTISPDLSDNVVDFTLKDRSDYLR